MLRCMRRVKKLLKILLFVVLVPPALLFLIATIQVLREDSPAAPQVTEAPLYTFVPTEAPTEKPTAMPTKAPTTKPTAAPTAAPTERPTQAPTAAPTKAPEPDITTPYVGNANSMKFHYAGCASVKKMSASNRVPLSSRDEAISRGYEPCKNCNP